MEHIRIAKVHDVKLERSRNTYNGTLHLFAHHLLFRQNGTELEVWISYSTILSIDRKFPTPTGHHPICITGRNFMFIKLFIPDERETNDVFASLQRLMNISSIEQLYAFHYKPVKPFKSRKGWRIYDPFKEFERQGVGVKSDQWRFTTCNENYEMCPTYPRCLIVPSKISDNVLRYTAKFRSKGRIPTLTYLHRSNMASITRSSQPLVGLKQSRSIQDEKLVEAIFTSSTSICHTLPTQHLIIDARPTANAMAQTALGAGTENADNYRGCKLEFLGIDNIHVVRDSFLKLLDAMNAVDNGPVPRAMLDKSGWLKHIRNIMEGTLTIVQHIHLQNSHVLVHCSDGWDRTSQLCGLAELCLDPYFRTIEGFAVLVEKEWVSFGHKFQDRCGHLSRDAATLNDRSSVGAQLQAARRNVSNSITSAAKGFFSKNIAEFAQGAVGGGASADLGSNTGGSFGSPRSVSYPGNANRSFHNVSTGNGDLANATTSPGNASPLAGRASTTPRGSSSLPPPPLTSAEVSTPHTLLPREVAPIFTQFLDCVYQLWVQFPTHFEFSEKLLSTLNLHIYSSQFGTFLFNNERERKNFIAPGNATVEEATCSIWDFIESNRDDYLNAHYIQPEIRYSSGSQASPAASSGLAGGSRPIGSGTGQVGLGGLPGTTSSDGQVLYPSTQSLKYWIGLCVREEEDEMARERDDEVNISTVRDTRSNASASIPSSSKSFAVDPPVLEMENPWEEPSDGDTQGGEISVLSESEVLVEPGDESEALVEDLARSFDEDTQDLSARLVMASNPSIEIQETQTSQVIVSGAPSPTAQSSRELAAEAPPPADSKSSVSKAGVPPPHPLWDPDIG